MYPFERNSNGLTLYLLEPLKQQFDILGNLIRRLMVSLDKHKVSLSVSKASTSNEKPVPKCAVNQCYQVVNSFKDGTS